MKDIIAVKHLIRYMYGGPEDLIVQCGTVTSGSETCFIQYRRVATSCSAE